MITKGDLHIRKMTRNDYKVMAKWLSDQNVLKYYEEPLSNLEKVIEKFAPRISGEHYVTSCIVEFKDISIGYIQYYKLTKPKLIEYGYAANQVIFGIDQFIGETQLWGKGIGTSMIRLILNYLTKIEPSSKEIIDVKKTNDRAISCYKKCGFRRLKNLSDEFVLMECKLNKPLDINYGA
jgi:aminoglycoside 6'-N-acetyltransferase